MASLKRDVSSINPEQKTLLEIFEKTAYRHSYFDTFCTLIDFMIHEFTATEHPLIKSEYSFPKSYDVTEQSQFKTMLREIQNLCFDRCKLWNGANGWYDPFGCLFENVSSSFTKQKSGQFFTPETVCEMMVRMSIEKPTAENIGKTVLDPCCGSGRFLLAASNINPGLYCIGNDIDSLCVKMTALNMCLNGAIGEVSCNDGLMATEDNFRFGYKIVPVISLFNDDIVKAVFSNNPILKKQYCLLDLDFQNCIYQQAEPQQKEFFVNHAETHAEHRKQIHPEGIQGILFEAETIVKAKKETATKDNKPKLTTAEKFSLLLDI